MSYAGRNTMSEIYYTPEEIATRIPSVTAKQVRDWVRRGVLQCVRPKRRTGVRQGRILISESAFQSWISGDAPQPASQPKPSRKRQSQGESLLELL